MTPLEQLFDTAQFIPQGKGEHWSPGLMWAEIGASALIGVAFLVVSGALFKLVGRLEDVPFRTGTVAFAILFFTCGLTHLFDVVVVWEPYYWVDAGLRMITAAVSVTVALLVPALLRGHQHIPSTDAPDNCGDGEAERSSDGNRGEVNEGEGATPRPTPEPGSLRPVSPVGEDEPRPGEFPTPKPENLAPVDPDDLDGASVWAEADADSDTPKHPFAGIDSPLPDDAVSMQLGTKQSEAPPPIGESVLLVVEDSVVMNEYICETLDDQYLVVSVFDGDQALEKLDRHDVDVIVTDLMMPNMAGERFIERAVEIGDFPILVVTAKVDDQIRTDLLQKGANDFLPKPFSPEELRTRVSNLVSIRRTRKLLQRELQSKREGIEMLARRLALRKNELQNALETARVAREHAERASRMKTEFLGMVSHELRTPLTALKMQFHLLEQRLDTSGEGPGELLERIAGVIDRLLYLIEGLLNQAALESGQLEVDPERFDLAELVETIVEDNRAYAVGCGLDFELEIEGEPEPVVTDERLVRLVVSNLVRNAIKFTETGGVYVSCSQDHGESEIAVRDTGPGIDLEEQSEIFRAFEQGAEMRDLQVPGVGLGLSVARDMVRALGGSIDVESEPGAGSTFTMRFPSFHRAGTEAAAV